MEQWIVVCVFLNRILIYPILLRAFEKSAPSAGTFVRRYFEIDRLCDFGVGENNKNGTMDCVCVFKSNFDLSYTLRSVS